MYIAVIKIKVKINTSRSFSSDYACGKNIHKTQKVIHQHNSSSKVCLIKMF